ncbi:MAG: hypothetical protein WAO08_19025, partial [Hyphomicrobiaceae bacterium]
RDEPQEVAPRETGNGQDSAGAARPAQPPETEPIPFPPSTAPASEAVHEEAEEDYSSRPIRRGWWQRRFTST